MNHFDHGNQKDELAISASIDPFIGTFISGEFMVESVLGTGAWGRVYHARQKSKGRNVALKLLHSHLLVDEQIVLRFEREARSGFSIKHPNICEFFCHGFSDSGQPYIAMEYLEGENLASRLRRRSSLSPDDFLSVFIGCARGLKAAQDRRIVHRDIKPANIFLSKKDQQTVVKLLDFGMAKILADGNDLTQTGPGFGTVHYMSPEQVLGEDVDTRSDIYSLGCVMYEALTGRKVFSGKSAYQIMEQHVREVPVKPSHADDMPIQPDLEALVLQCLEKDPEKRFQTADAVIGSLIAACPSISNASERAAFGQNIPEEGC